MKQGGVYYIKTQEERAKEPTESANYTLSYAQAKDIAAAAPDSVRQRRRAADSIQRTNTIFLPGSEAQSR